MTQLYPILSIEAAKAHEASILEADAAKTTQAMENAGQAIGRALLQDFLEVRPWPDAPCIHILAGKGLNTGDALVACEVFVEAMPSLQVMLIHTADEEQFNPIAGTVLKRLQEKLGSRLRTCSCQEYLEAPAGPCQLLLDGLYGHGFRPPLDKDVAALLEKINSQDDIELRAAIDLPSGIGGESDPNAFRADLTYVPGVAKAPCFDTANADKVGRIRFLEIDPFLNPDVNEEQVDFVASPKAFTVLNRVRRSQTDKRSYGHCLILAGSSQMPGAALMATMGCLQAGAGLVTTFTPVTVATQIASRVPEAMWRPLPVTPDGGLEVESVRIINREATKAQALLIGPGLVLDRSTVFTLSRVIRETPIPLVLDASALTQDVIAAVLGRSLSAGPVIVTPHAGEFARMHGIKESGDPVQELIRFSQKYRALTVLKGSPTYVSDGKRRIAVPAGGPVLARGGAGDILAGMLTLLLAQNPGNPLQAALQAISWHGAAADELARRQGAIAVQTTEILPHLSTSLRAQY